MKVCKDIERKIETYNEHPLAGPIRWNKVLLAIQEISEHYLEELDEREVQVQNIRQSINEVKEGIKWLRDNKD